jgi:hypothetical protein
MDDWLGFVTVHQQQQHFSTFQEINLDIRRLGLRLRIQSTMPVPNLSRNFEYIVSMSSIKPWIPCCTKGCKCKRGIILTNMLLEVS